MATSSNVTTTPKATAGSGAGRLVSSPVNQRNGLVSDPLRNFRFVVKFRPYDQKFAPWSTGMNFGFASVSGLSVATEAIPYREGAMNTTLHQLPGQTTFSPVTLAHGVHLGNSMAWDWMRRLFSVTAPRSGPTTAGARFQFRSAVDIHVLQHPIKRTKDSFTPVTGVNEEAQSLRDAVGVSFRLHNAWLTALSYADLNAGDNAVMVEQMTLVHEGFDMLWQTSDGTDAGGAEGKFPV